MVPFFLPYSRRCTRLSATARPRRCGPVKRGGGVLREREGPRLNLAPRIYTRTCWGARWRGASGLRGDARERKRERERDRLGAASRTRVATHGGQRRHGKARPRKWRALTKATAPSSQPGTKAGITGITSGGAEHRCVPPRLDGRGNHKRREAVVLTSVATGQSAGVGVV
jgi:hypothetical protein